MANHMVYLDLDILMDEMDGSPDESAEVVLDVYLNDMLEALRKVGVTVHRLEVTYAEEWDG